MPTTSSTTSTLSFHDALSVRLDQGTVAKEVRAHEHARHRTKERREHALAKERKEKATAVRALGLKGCNAHAHVHGAKLVRKHSMESWDGEEPEEARSIKEVFGTPVQALGPELGSGHDVMPRERTIQSPFTELTLGDLISKPRRPKAKQLDFEVIPPIRAVIALDDAETEEAWEYVTRASLNDGSAWMGKSYAQAVVSAM